MNVSANYFWFRLFTPRVEGRVFKSAIFPAGDCFAGFSDSGYYFDCALWGVIVSLQRRV